MSINTSGISKIPSSETSPTSFNPKQHPTARSVSSGRVDVVWFIQGSCHPPPLPSPKAPAPFEAPVGDESVPVGEESMGGAKNGYQTLGRIVLVGARYHIIYWFYTTVGVYLSMHQATKAVDQAIYGPQNWLEIDQSRNGSSRLLVMLFGCDSVHVILSATKHQRCEGS